MFNFSLWRLRRQTWLGLARGGPVAWLDLAWSKISPATCSIFFSVAFGTKLGLARGGPMAWLGLVKIFSGAFGAACSCFSLAPSAPNLAWLGLVKIFFCAFGATSSFFVLRRLRRQMFNFFLWRLRRQTWLGLAWLEGGPWLGSTWLGQNFLLCLRRHIFIFVSPAPLAPNLA